MRGRQQRVAQTGDPASLALEPASNHMELACRTAVPDLFIVIDPTGSPTYLRAETFTAAEAALPNEGRPPGLRKVRHRPQFAGWAGILDRWTSHWGQFGQNKVCGVSGPAGIGRRRAGLL